MAFNGFSEFVRWGRFSTPALIVSTLAAEASRGPTPALPRLYTQGVCAEARFRELQTFSIAE